MDFNATIDLIIKDLKEASDIIDDLKKYPGVPVLQVELAKMKCRSAGEVISILKNINENPVTGDKEPIREKIIQKVQKPDEPGLQTVREIIPPVPQVSKGKAATPEPEIQPELKTPEPKSAGHKIAEPKKTYKKEQDSPIIADQFLQPPSSLVEQLSAAQTEAEIADTLKTKPITSLIEAIGINDKFLFIREIFNGNHNDYSAALQRLENADNMIDARAVIMSYTGDNSESEAVRQLLDLVKRKLPSDE
jgi:hypothetical protein